ncbi:MAG: response regulator [Spartobacteria bacterium]|nr:response regulator [Spartobacteria bacterium]
MVHLKKLIKRKIALRLALTLAAMVFAIGLISTVLFRAINGYLMKDYLRTIIHNTESFARLAYPQPLWNIDLDVMRQLNYALMNNEAVVAVNVFDERGYISGLQRGSVYSLKHEASTPYVIPDHSPYHIYLVEQPIRYNDRAIGKIFIYYTDAEINALNHRSTIQIAIISFFIMLVNLFLTYWGVRRLIIAPILKLADFTQDVALSRNYSLRISRPPGNDEMSHLFDNFNYLLDQVCSHSQQRDTMEKQLFDAQHFMNDIIDSIPTILVTIDTDGTVTLANATAKRLFDTGQKALIGSNAWEELPALAPYRHACDVLLEDRNPSIIYRVKNKLIDADAFYDVSLYPLIKANGLLNGIVLSLSDVTEMTKKEQDLQQAQKMEMIGNLAGGLAHDFNNILGGIVGTISIIKHRLTKNGCIPNEKLEPLVSLMESASHRAIDLVRQLLTISRKQEVTYVPVNLYNAVLHTIKICKNSFDKCVAIEFAPRVDNSECLVTADPTQLEQVLLNLCINAYDAMTSMRPETQPAGGQLTIMIEQVTVDKSMVLLHPEAVPGFYWKIAVHDTGVGIDKSIMSTIFDPFFATKNKEKGTGLGLSMVAGIINRHKGIVDVYSEAGAGTTFSVYLPCAVSAENLAEQVPKPVLSQGNGTILVIDDEEEMRQVAKLMLQEYGYDVLLATDGQTGISMYKRHQSEISAVILDIVMPNMPGQDAYKLLKKINPNVIVLLASGFFKDERVTETLKAGANAFISKPYTLDNLMKTLQQVLSAK